MTRAPDRNLVTNSPILGIKTIGKSNEIYGDEAGLRGLIALIEKAIVSGTAATGDANARLTVVREAA